MFTLLELSQKHLFATFKVFTILKFLSESEMQNVQTMYYVAQWISEFWMPNVIQYVLSVFIFTLLFNCFFKINFFSEDHLIYKLISKQKIVLFSYPNLLFNISTLHITNYYNCANLKQICKMRRFWHWC